MDAQDGEPLLLRVAERDEWQIDEDDVTGLRETKDESGGAAIAFGFSVDREGAIGAFMETGVGQKLAIAVGNHILSTATLHFPMKAGGIISGGNSGFAEVEARDVVGAMMFRIKGVRLGPASPLEGR